MFSWLQTKFRFRFFFHFLLSPSALSSLYTAVWSVSCKMHTLSCGKKRLQNIQSRYVFVSSLAHLYISCGRMSLCEYVCIVCAWDRESNVKHKNVWFCVRTKEFLFYLCYAGYFALKYYVDSESNLFFLFSCVIFSGEWIFPFCSILSLWLKGYTTRITNKRRCCTELNEWNAKRHGRNCDSIRTLGIPKSIIN